MDVVGEELAGDELEMSITVGLRGEGADADIYSWSLKAPVDHGVAHAAGQ